MANIAFLSWNNYLNRMYRKEDTISGYLSKVSNYIIQSDINFGSQIRSYVMCPYSMVKDHRTNIESSNPVKVLDGDLDIFINAYLKYKAGGK